MRFHSVEAIAVGFAQQVVNPRAGNIGGGGFMMVAPPGKEPTCFEYRETAPAAAKVDLFADGTVTVSATGSIDLGPAGQGHRRSVAEQAPHVLCGVGGEKTQCLGQLLCSLADRSIGRTNSRVNCLA